MLTGIPVTDDPAHRLVTVPAKWHAAYCSSTVVFSKPIQIRSYRCLSGTLGSARHWRKGGSN